MDTEIECDLAVAPAVVSWQPGFVARLARDVAAAKEQFAHRVDFCIGDDGGACPFDVVDGGLRGKHCNDVERSEDPALVGSVRVDIDNERGSTGAVALGGDRFNNGGDTPRVVPVPVR